MLAVLPCVHSSCHRATGKRARARPGIGPARRQSRAEDGALGGWEVLPFGVLVLLVGTLVIANAWGVVDAKMAATAGAREGAQAYARAPSASVAAERAVEAANASIAAHRHGAAEPESVAVEGAFRRCAEVEVVVDVAVPAVRLPWIGGFGGDLVVGGTHREIVDPLRGGVPGDADGSEVTCGAG